MSLVEFKRILKFFGGGEPSAEERNQLFKEAVFMALARATSADTNIKSIELENVQGILKRVTGEEVPLSEIKTGAQSELFESQPLAKYLAGVGRKLDQKQRITLMQCLAEVIRSDERVSHFETDYFDMVAKALSATPSELVGLISGD